VVPDAYVLTLEVAPGKPEDLPASPPTAAAAAAAPVTEEEKYKTALAKWQASGVR
jgi:hypothetical protein